jgi:hypothetical protein
MNVAAGVTAVGGDPTAYTDGTKTMQWPWPMYPAALNYCGQAGYGQYDLSNIQLVGPMSGTIQTATAAIQAALVSQHAAGGNAGLNYYVLHPSILNELVTGYGRRDPS